MASPIAAARALFLLLLVGHASRPNLLVSAQIQFQVQAQDQTQGQEDQTKPQTQPQTQGQTQPLGTHSFSKSLYLDLSPLPSGFGSDGGVVLQSALNSFRPKFASAFRQCVEKSAPLFGSDEVVIAEMSDPMFNLFQWDPVPSNSSTTGATSIPVAPLPYQQPNPSGTGFVQLIRYRIASLKASPNANIDENRLECARQAFEDPASGFVEVLRQSGSLFRDVRTVQVYSRLDVEGPYPNTYGYLQLGGKVDIILGPGLESGYGPDEELAVLSALNDEDESSGIFTYLATAWKEGIEEAMPSSRVFLIAPYVGDAGKPCGPIGSKEECLTFLPGSYESPALPGYNPAGGTLNNIRVNNGQSSNLVVNPPKGNLVEQTVLDDGTVRTTFEYKFWLRWWAPGDEADITGEDVVKKADMDQIAAETINANRVALVDAIRAADATGYFAPIQAEQTRAVGPLGNNPGSSVTTPAGGTNPDYAFGADEFDTLFPEDPLGCEYCSWDGRCYSLGDKWLMDDGRSECTCNGVKDTKCVGAPLQFTDVSRVDKCGLEVRVGCLIESTVNDPNPVECNDYVPQTPEDCSQKIRYTYYVHQKSYPSDAKLISALRYRDGSAWEAQHGNPRAYMKNKEGQTIVYFPLGGQGYTLDTWEGEIADVCVRKHNVVDTKFEVITDGGALGGQCIRSDSYTFVPTGGSMMAAGQGENTATNGNASSGTSGGGSTATLEAVPKPDNPSCPLKIELLCMVDTNGDGEGDTDCNDYDPTKNGGCFAETIYIHKMHNKAPFNSGIDVTLSEIYRTRPGDIPHGDRYDFIANLYKQDVVLQPMFLTTIKESPKINFCTPAQTAYGTTFHTTYTITGSTAQCKNEASYSLKLS